MSKQNDETLYVIYYIAPLIPANEERSFEAITNNFDAWLKDHNSHREEGTEEDAYDFDVEEVEVSYFKEIDEVYDDSGDYLTNYNNADEHEIYGVNPLDYEK